MKIFTYIEPENGNISKNSAGCLTLGRQLADLANGSLTAIVPAQENRDSDKSEIVGEAGEDMVPKSQGEVQEGGSPLGPEPEMLLSSYVREEEGGYVR